jgi:diacylglycerol O-acyltransferase / wax synthase
MVRIDTPLSVHSSPERVFEFLADLRHEAEWNPNTLGAQVDGPIGVGTVFHVLGKVMGRETPFDVRVVRYEPPRLVEAVMDLLPMQIRYTYTVEPSEDGVRVLHSADIEPRGMMKMMAPFVGKIFRNHFDVIFPKLKELLEKAV